MNKSHKYSLISIQGVLLLGAILRFALLGSIPRGFSVDEAAKGYNAYSIIKTGKDMRGNFLPLRFTDFSDKRPYTIILYTYLSIPFVAVLGLNETSVRLLAAAVGTLTLAILYLLTKKVFNSKTVGLLAAFLLSISPWHILMSRVGLEAVIFPLLFLTTWYLLIISLKKTGYIVLASVTLFLSFYSYQTSYVIMPIFLALFFIFHRDKLNSYKTKQKLIILAMLITVIGILPLITLYITDFTNMTGHFHGESISNLVKNKALFPLLVLTQMVFHYISLQLLLLYHIPTLIGFYFGLLLLIKKIYKKKLIFGKELFLLLMLVTATIPSAFSANSSIPNLTRSIGMLGIVEMVAAYGIYKYKKYHSPAFRKLFALAIFLNSTAMIYFGYPENLGPYIWLQYGFKEVAKYVENVGNKYDKIVITNKANQPFIYFLFYNKFPPEKFHKEKVIREYTSNFTPYETVKSFNKYIFCDISTCYNNYDNALYIARPNEVEATMPIANIKIKNKEVFSILTSKK